MIELTREEAISIAFDDTDNELSEKEVIACVEEFQIKTQTRNFCHPTNIAITNKYYANNETQTRGLAYSAPFYKVKFKKGNTNGMAVVSGDRRSSGVIAYLEQSNDSLKDENGKNYMLELAQKYTMLEIDKVIRTENELREKTLIKIANKLGVSLEELNLTKIRKNIIIAENSTRSVAYDTPLTSIESGSGPFIAVKWGQFTPYNMYLPECTVERTMMYIDDDGNVIEGIGYRNSKYPAGCGVIALAQALTYIQPTLTIDGTAVNWGLLNEHPILNYNPGGSDMTLYPHADMAAKLVKYIYEQTEATANFGIKDPANFSESDAPLVLSTSVTTEAMESFIGSLCNYNRYNRWAANEILATVMNNRIAILIGCDNGDTSRGHAWIIDGYAQCTKTTRAIIQNYDLYFHASMGWSGTDDGYYRFDADATIDFETTNGIYNSNFIVFANIRKK